MKPAGVVEDACETDGLRAPMAARPALTVVIPCLDVADILPRQLDALAAQSWHDKWDVVIADNGSHDGTRAVAERYASRLPGLRVVDASRHRGRHHACNVGARVAGAALVFVDADDEVAPGYVAAIGDALAAHPIVAARIDHDTLNAGWAKDANAPVQTDDLQRGFGFLPFGSGGTLGVRHDVWDELGGFADDTEYAEDVDFCWRAQLAGIAVHFVPDAVLRYQYRPRVGAMYRQHRNFGRGGAYLYRRYRAFGMPRRSGREAASEWYGIAKQLALVRSWPDAARWSRRVGRAIGRLQGSLRYRVWYP